MPGELYSRSTRKKSEAQCTLSLESSTVALLEKNPRHNALLTWRALPLLYSKKKTEPQRQSKVGILAIPSIIVKHAFSILKGVILQIFWLL